PRPARLHRGHHADRRQGVVSAGMADPIRIALLGAGFITDFHARAVIEHPAAELVAAANWRPASLAALAQRHGIARTTLEWEQLVGDSEVDAVVIATPNVLHAAQAIAFLEAGQHVLVEKPMAMTV